MPADRPVERKPKRCELRRLGETFAARGKPRLAVDRPRTSVTLTVALRSKTPARSACPGSDPNAPRPSLRSIASSRPPSASVHVFRPPWVRTTNASVRSPISAQRIVVAPAGSISEFKKDVVAGCHTRLVVHWRSLVKHPGNASGSPGGKGVKTLRVATPGGNVRCQRETPPRRGSAVNLRDPHRSAPIQDAISLGVFHLRSQRPAPLTKAHRCKSSAQRQCACLPTTMDPHNQRISPVFHFCTTSSPLTPARGRGFDCGLKVELS